MKKCAVLECKNLRVEGRYVCAEHVPMFDRIRADIEQNTFQVSGSRRRQKDDEDFDFFEDSD